MSVREKEMLRIMELAISVVIVEDRKLLEELGKR